MSKFKELISGNKPVLVDFYADWCGPCKILTPIVKEMASVFGERLTIIKVDVDKNAQASAAYQIQGIPTLILFKNGNIIWRTSGVLPAHQLKAILEKLI